MNRRAGFTLIEVVVAIFIAAVMFAIGYRALNQALLDRESINASQARVGEIQRGMRIVAQDLSQVVARPARDVQSAGELLPAIYATNRDNTLVTFTRTGWSNPVGIPRPAEQRVRYLFLDGSLVREHWPAVDSALNTAPIQRVLMTKVKSVDMRFLDPVSRTWREDWPVAAPTGPVGPLNVDEGLRTRPLAIEFTLELEDWGRVLRVFEIPT